MLTGPQIRAARALVGLSQVQVAERAGVASLTIKRIEGQDGPLRGSYQTVERIRAALEAAGVEFIEGGVRVRPESAS